MNSNHINFCDGVRSSDQIFDHFQILQHRILNTLVHDPRHLKYILPTLHSDHRCLYNLGFCARRSFEEIMRQPSPIETWANVFICSGCKLIFRLADPLEFELNQPFPVQTGRLIGQSCVLSEMPMAMDPVCQIIGRTISLNPNLADVLISWYLEQKGHDILHVHMSFYLVINTMCFMRHQHIAPSVTCQNHIKIQLTF